MVAFPLVCATIVPAPLIVPYGFILWRQPPWPACSPSFWSAGEDLCNVANG
jgi:hypothetical protein